MKLHAVAPVLSNASAQASFSGKRRLPAWALLATMVLPLAAAGKDVPPQKEGALAPQKAQPVIPEPPAPDEFITLQAQSNGGMRIFCGSKGQLSCYKQDPEKPGEQVKLSFEGNGVQAVTLSEQTDPAFKFDPKVSPPAFKIGKEDRVTVQGVQPKEGVWVEKDAAGKERRYKSLLWPPNAPQFQFVTSEELPPEKPKAPPNRPRQQQPPNVKTALHYPSQGWPMQRIHTAKRGG